MFFKREDKFYIHMRNISKNLIESTEYFVTFDFNNSKDVKEFAETMKFYENKGDGLVHKVIHDLNKVFITPIEREDILALATHMDDVLDGMEGTAALLDIYSIEKFDHYMKKFLDFINKSVIEIHKSIELISQKKLLDMREHIIRIKDYESKCDDLRRESLKNLFNNEKDPITLIKYKEIYEELERITDYCEAVANTLEAVIMKNA
ncbi:MAG TPA: DUF47 domain-containing protein [Pseudogracilibacillus sp.]|nr:DUF47 domain-containing protein [Pseudogracilibacillus sp.]